MIEKQQNPVLRDVESITPYPNNVKKHPDAQVKKLAESIKRFGWRGNPILVDSEGVIIAGHGRRLAAMHLGLEKVPVVVIEDMSAEQARAFRLVDNRAAISDIDGDMLEQELLEFDGLSDLLDGIFDTKELDFAIADLMEMDESAFETDLSGVINEQEQQTDSKIQAAGEKAVPILRALGLQGKSVPGSEVIHLSRFMANLQASYDAEDPVAALVAYAKEFNEGEAESHP